MRGLLLLLALSTGCAGGTKTGPSLPEGPVALRYRGIDGGWRSLARLRGRPVVVSVVATWAGPALVEVQRLRTLQKAREGAFAVVLLVVDEDPQMAAIFAERFEVPDVVGRVEDVARFTGPRGPLGPIGVVPTSVLLDGEGRIALRSDGPWPEGVLARALDRLGAR